ncbi:winged helix-turn-helix transcriptional regulator [Paraburkholderia bryophila]|uniref:HxlR family transcriptional regulator n=1 Tax=Paraburkholderia bryophila TaxID=420952 RepID=A0A329CAS9_9BURK|nr:helix-turn-helix domain-containing protein [Paraburkholderia bryophila]RAS32096.1 HxlR family transcriptional regulator [Paraburkholderia bryophila]
MIDAPRCSAEQLTEALRVLEGRWKTLIIYHLFTAPVLRFSELRRAIPGVSQKMLIQQLRDLERDGVISRTVYPEVPPKVEYGLTKEGRALQPALKALQKWAAQRQNTGPVEETSAS